MANPETSLTGVWVTVVKTTSCGVSEVLQPSRQSDCDALGVCLGCHTWRGRLSKQKACRGRRTHPLKLAGHVE